MDRQQKLSMLNKEYEMLLIEYDKGLKSYNDDSYGRSKILELHSNLIKKQNQINALITEINDNDEDSV